MVGQVTTVREMQKIDSCWKACHCRVYPSNATLGIGDLNRAAELTA